MIRAILLASATVTSMRGLVDLTANRYMLSHSTRVALRARLMAFAEAARRYAIAFAEDD